MSNETPPLSFSGSSYENVPPSATVKLIVRVTLKPSLHQSGAASLPRNSLARCVSHHSLPGPKISF